MPLQIDHPDLLPLTWTIGTLLILAAIVVALWLTVHFLMNKFVTKSFLINSSIFIAGTAVGTAALWLVTNVLSRFILLQTSWSILGICFAISLAIAIVSALYRFEKSFVDSPTAWWLHSLRVILLLGLGLTLMQPIFALNFPKKHEKYVAVLLDESQSMQVVDEQLTDSEKLALVTVLNPDFPKPPYQLTGTSADLIATSRQLSNITRQIKKELTADETRLAANNQIFLAKIQQAKTATQRAQQQLNDLLKVSNINLNSETKSQVTQIASDFDSKVTPQLFAAQSTLESPTPDYNSSAAQLNSAAIAIRSVADRVPSILNIADRAYFASLSKNTADTASQTLTRTRSELAKLILSGNEQVEGLIEKIREGYEVKIYRFDSQPSQLDSESFQTDTTSAATISKCRFPTESRAKTTCRKLNICE